ncbi:MULTISPECIES: peptidase M6 [unclassified Streptomyces]|uniref:peptidase M6 n=1 Tax=unclassified Streptomyces TaxID=2593676 RepID=UPI002E1136B4|nr:peptidase M6 [Streptomyces sp. NBC_01186]WSS40747.1 peptidase M6 [Streptomyces sp. NBC_01187]
MTPRRTPQEPPRGPRHRHPRSPRRPRPAAPARRPAAHRPALAVATALATACLTLAPVNVAAAEGIAGPCAIAAGSGTDEGPLSPAYVHPQGHKRALMLMVDFSDLPATTRATDRAGFFSGYGDRFLNRASFGKYRLDVQPSDDWIRMPRPWASYRITRGIPTSVMRGYVQDALDAAERQGTDVKGADLVFVVADTNVPAAPTVSQAHTFEGLRAGGTRVGGAALIFGRADDAALWQRGNFVHEANHLYGLPDLYNVAEGASVEYAGGWDTMSMAGISDLLGWHKWKFGWLSRARVNCVTAPGTTEHTLSPISDEGANIAVIRTGRHRAIVAEARSRSGLDRDICAEGVLLYTVDSRVPTGEGPVRVVDSRPRSSGGMDCADRLPSELAEMSDAPFAPGESHTFRDGVRVEVHQADGSGYRVLLHMPGEHHADGGHSR